MKQVVIYHLSNITTFVLAHTQTQAIGICWLKKNCEYRLPPVYDDCKKLIY